MCAGKWNMVTVLSQISYEPLSDRSEKKKKLVAMHDVFMANLIYIYIYNINMCACVI